MRRVDLDHANAETQDVLDIGHDVGGVARMQLPQEIRRLERAGSSRRQTG